MLIPMGEFQVLIDDLQALQRDTMVQTAVDSSDLRRTIDCPQCHHAMEAHFYAGPGNVTIDSCDPCSLNWLDHGELMRIVHAPDERHTADYVSSASAYGTQYGGAVGPLEFAMRNPGALLTMLSQSDWTSTTSPRPSTSRRNPPDRKSVV